MLISLLRGLLPRTVIVEELFGDSPTMELFAVEAALMAEAADRRRREFASVRACARQALSKLSHAPEPILPLGDAAPPWASGAPRWPVGIVGSMTHCYGYRAAALAHRADMASIGIDAEPHLPLPAGVKNVIASAPEREALAPLQSAHPEVAFGRVLFSAKESIYKAWFSLTGCWLDFLDCAVTLGSDGDFTAVLKPNAVPNLFAARSELAGSWRLLSAKESGTPSGLIGTTVGVQDEMETLKAGC